MDGDRTQRALLRIDLALNRIEAAAAKPGENQGNLAVRHERLRGAVTEALGQLDMLIGGKAL